MKSGHVRKFLVTKYTCLRISQQMGLYQKYKEKLTTSIVHSEVRILRGAFLKWRESYQKSKRLKEALIQTEKSCQNFVLKRALKVWRSETNRKIDLNYLLSIALSKEMDKKFLLRKYLILWKQMSDLNRKYELQLQNSYERLCGQVLAKWRHAAANQKLARGFNLKKSVQNALSIWSRKLEYREDLEIQDQLRIADDYYRFKLMVKFWNFWVEIKTRSESYRKLERRADEVFNLNVYGRVLSKWQNRVIEKEKYSELVEKADKFRSDVLLSQFCYGMWRESDRLAGLRSKEVIVQSFSNRNLLKRVFRRAEQAIHSKSSLQKALDAARQHYNRNLVAKGLQGFKILADEGRSVSAALNLAEDFERNNTKNRALIQWKLFVKMNKMKQQSDLIRSRLVFRFWRSITHETKQKVKIADEFAATKRSILVLECFRQWQNNAKSSASQKFYLSKMIENAVRFHRKTILDKCYEGLMAAIIVRRRSRETQNILLNKNRVKICELQSRSTLKRPLAHWLERTRSSSRLRSLEDQSKNVEQCRLIKTVHSRFLQWLQWRSKKEHLEYRADQFGHLALRFRTLKRLRLAVEHSRNEAKNTEKALSHLYQSITWNVMRRWKAYTIRQKTKNEYYNTAFQLHQEIERSNWCEKADTWASKDQNAKNIKASSLYGEKYVKICREVIDKWRSFVTRKKVVNKKRKLIAKIEPKQVDYPAMGDCVAFEPIKFRTPRIPDFLAAQQPRTSSAITGHLQTSSPSESSVVENSTPEVTPEPIELYFIDEVEYERKKKNESSGIGQVVRPENPEFSPQLTPEPLPHQSQFRADLALHFELFHRQKEQLQRQLSYQTYLWQLNNSSLPDPIFNHSPLMMNTTDRTDDSSLGYFGHETIGRGSLKVFRDSYTV